MFLGSRKFAHTHKSPNEGLGTVSDVGQVDPESCSAASALGQLLGTLFSITVYANNKANV